MPEFKEGELIIYQNGDRFEIGKIKRIVSDGAFYLVQRRRDSCKDAV